MTIVLDNCVRKRLVRFFEGHSVVHVSNLGWSDLKNGQLLRQADSQFDVLVTVDKNMRFQSNLTGLSLRVAVLDVQSNDFAQLAEAIHALLSRLESLPEGEFTVIRL